MLKLSLQICLLILSCLSGIYSSIKRPGIQSRIIGGVVSSINNFPYQASILVNSVHHCGGSIISPILILTANHCVEKRSKSQLKVRVGSTTWNGDGDGTAGFLIYVAQIVEHEHYDTETVENDISILVLEQSLEKHIENGFVSIIKITNVPIENLYDKTCVISGWGKLADDGRFPNRLRSTNIKIFSKNTCDSLLTLSPKTFCAGYLAGGIDSCEGDSGGPLVCNGAQCGIVSWGSGCGRPNSPGVYVDLYEYRTWIEKVMQHYY